jgi:hypothetical protein
LLPPSSNNTQAIDFIDNLKVGTASALYKVLITTM